MRRPKIQCNRGCLTLEGTPGTYAGRLTRLFHLVRDSLGVFNIGGRFAGKDIRQHRDVIKQEAIAEKKARPPCSVTFQSLEIMDVMMVGPLVLEITELEADR